MFKDINEFRDCFGEYGDFTNDEVLFLRCWLLSSCHFFKGIALAKEDIEGGVFGWHKNTMQPMHRFRSLRRAGKSFFSYAKKNGLSKKPITDERFDEKKQFAFYSLLFDIENCGNVIIDNIIKSRLFLFFDINTYNIFTKSIYDNDIVGLQTHLNKYLHYESIEKTMEQFKDTYFCDKRRKFINKYTDPKLIYNIEQANSEIMRLFSKIRFELLSSVNIA